MTLLTYRPSYRGQPSLIPHALTSHRQVTPLEEEAAVAAIIERDGFPVLTKHGVYGTDVMETGEAVWREEPIRWSPRATPPHESNSPPREWGISSARVSDAGVADGCVVEDLGTFEWDGLDDKSIASEEWLDATEALLAKQAVWDTSTSTCHENDQCCTRRVGGRIAR